MVTNSDVSLSVTCITDLYSFAVDVQGLTGTGLVLTLNGAESRTVNANGRTTFTTKYPSETPLDLVVTTQPNGPNEMCLPLYNPATMMATATTTTVICGPRRHAFISSALYNGNLGGLPGADAKCQGLADAAGLGGTYKAWLGDTTVDVYARFSRRNGPWLDANGALIALGSTTSLFEEVFATRLQVTETGGPAPQGTNACGPTFMFTQHSSGAGMDKSHCANWTSTTHPQGASLERVGPGGFPNSGGGCWLASCAGTAPIACFEQ